MAPDSYLAGDWVVRGARLSTMDSISESGQASIWIRTPPVDGADRGSGRVTEHDRGPTQRGHPRRVMPGWRDRNRLLRDDSRRTAMVAVEHPAGADRDTQAAGTSEGINPGAEVRHAHRTVRSAR